MCHFEYNPTCAHSFDPVHVSTLSSDPLSLSHSWIHTYVKQLEEALPSAQEKHGGADDSSTEPFEASVEPYHIMVSKDDVNGSTGSPPTDPRGDMSREAAASTHAAGGEVSGDQRPPVPIPADSGAQRSDRPPVPIPVDSEPSSEQAEAINTAELSSRYARWGWFVGIECI